MYIQIISTSCNRRELELEQVKMYLVENGHTVSQEDFDTDVNADCIILSTCGFTQAAEDFAIKTLKRIDKEKKSGCRVIVGGCLPKINPIVLDNYELFDPRSYSKLDEYLSASKSFESFSRPNTVGEWQIHSAYREHGLMSSDKDKIDSAGKNTVKDNIKSVIEIADIVRENSEKTFRIQCLVGCNCKCTYCAIKYAIGTAKSRPIENIVSDVKKGISLGYKNILLEGDSLGCFGIDSGTNIGNLLDSIINIIKDEDVEISVPDISPQFLSLCFNQIITLAQMGKMFNFYIPLQSGSQKVLNLMKRGYKVDTTQDCLREIKKACPQLKIGTSIIVGFPGETEEDFLKTIEVCKDIKFDYIFCHSYSDRKGTESSILPNKIEGEEILERSRRLKAALIETTPLITIAEDTSGNRTCQG